MGGAYLRAAFAALTVGVSACAGVPRLEEISPASTTDSRTEVTAIVRHIMCEVATARDASPMLKDSHELDGYWVAYNLSVKVEDATGLTPSLNWIDPMRASGTSELTSLGGELSRGRLRTFAHSAAIPIREIVTADYCQSNRDQAGNELTGSLGLGDVVSAGLNSIAALPPRSPPPQDEAAAAPDPAAAPPTQLGVVPKARTTAPATPPAAAQGAAPLAAAAGDKNERGSAPPKISGADTQLAFGSTIQFTYRRAVNGGRLVTRLRWKGPGGANGLLNASRTDTDQLIVGFTPVDAATARRIVETQQSELNQVR